MKSPLKTRALERAAHERRLLGIIRENYGDLPLDTIELRLGLALKRDQTDPPTMEDVHAHVATVTPKAKVKDWRTEQAERTSVPAEKRYGRKRKR